MALTSQEFSEMADLAAELGDEEAELEALEGMEGAGGFGEESEPTGFPGAGFIEPAAAVVSGLAAEVGGGIAGGVQALNPFAGPGAGAETVEATRDLAFKPTTEAGQAGLETLGSLIQKGVDIANIPLSGLAGIAELISGQGLDQAVETIKSTQEQGISKAGGERVFEETGSPLAATIAETAPTAVGTALGLPAAQSAVRGASAISPTVKAVAATGKEVATTGTELAKGVFQFQSSAKRKIAQLIEEGSTDVETARFKLTDQPKVEIKAPEGAPGLASPEPAARTAGAAGAAETVTDKLRGFLDIGGPRVKKDTAAINTINQGFDEGVIAAVKGASRSDKLAMRKMVEIAEKTKKNRLFGQRNRGSDVTGDLLMGRLNVVRTANKDAGKAIDKAAKGLKGKTINVAPAVDRFIDNLDDMGVSLTQVEGKMVPNFKGSDIEGLSGPENAIKRAVTRMTGTGAPDALQAHRLKRFIDEQVTFGKNAEGLAGKAERVLKKLRTNLDKELDNKFPAYNTANTQYSETIRVLNEFQSVAGQKMNLTGDNANKATGTLMRRLMGNAQSRIRLLDSVEEIEGAAKKFGGRLSDKELISGPIAKGAGNDLLTQVLFADELDAVFGPAARTSLQGQFDQALKQSARAATTKAGAADAALDVAGSVVEKARGINEAGAFKAIKELLRGKK